MEITIKNTKEDLVIGLIEGVLTIKLSQDWQWDEIDSCIYQVVKGVDVTTVFNYEDGKLKFWDFVKLEDDFLIEIEKSNYKRIKEFFED